MHARRGEPTGPLVVGLEGGRGRGRAEFNIFQLMKRLH